MNGDELSVLEEELKSIFQVLELGWVLSELDRTFEEGVAELRYLSRSSSQRYSSDLGGFYYEAVEFNEQNYAAAKKGYGKPVVATRQMTSAERVLQLIDTALVILVELPEAEEMAVKQAVEITGSQETQINFIGARDGGGASSFRFRIDRVDIETRMRLQNLLRQLRGEVIG